MSRFKDIVAKDIRSVFIQDEEFAEDHDIDNVTLSVVVDYDVINDQPIVHSEGTYLQRFTFFVCESELGYVPVEQQLMTFDGRQCIVVRVSSDMGLLGVTLEGNG